MTPAERSAVITKVIEQVARAYKRSCWWAELTDLVQEAWVAVLGAHPERWPEAGLRGFVATVAQRRLAHYLWEQSSPVGGRRGGRHFEGLQRAPLHLPRSRVGEGASNMNRERPELTHNVGPLAELERAEAAVLVERLRELLFWRVAEVYGEALDRLGQEARGLLLEAVLRVLLDGASSTSAATHTQTPLDAVYAETKRVKSYMLADQESRAILEEIAYYRRTLEDS